MPTRFCFFLLWILIVSKSTLVPHGIWDQKLKHHFDHKSNYIKENPKIVSVHYYVTAPRPQFQSWEVETLHAAFIHASAGFRPVEAGLRGLRGRQLICAIFSVKKS